MRAARLELGWDAVWLRKRCGRLPSTCCGAAAPGWSPNGKKIAFISDRDSNRQIYVMDANGGNVTQLTDTPFLDSHPDWSPDP